MESMSCPSEVVNSISTSLTLTKTEKYSLLSNYMKKIPIKNMNLEASILTLQSLLINSKPMAKTDFNKKFKFLNSMLLNSKFIFKNLDSLLKKLSRVSKVKEL